MDIYNYPISPVLNILLLNKSVDNGKDNLIWASSNVPAFNDWYRPDSRLTEANVYVCDLRPRVLKNSSEKKGRAKKHAEVFTPVWICNNMINLHDEMWFGRKDVFNTVDPDNDEIWVETDKIPFSNEKGKTWKDYVDIVYMEMTCGEAPFLVSRYNAATGEIIPLNKRIGVIDRKIRAINENTRESSREDWVNWVVRAFENCYGYEYQGDNLLVGRINLLLTFYEYYLDRWGEEPSVSELKHVAHKISWNLFQMDGLTYKVPYTDIDCVMQDWRSKKRIEVRTMKRLNPETCKNKTKKEFRVDVNFGNPPYQGDGQNLQQVYPAFYIEAIKNSEIVEMIFPSAWQEPKNGSGLGRMNKKEIKEDRQIVRIDNRENAFKGYDGAKNTNIIVWKKGYDNGLNGNQLIYKEGKNPVEKKLIYDANDIEKPSQIIELERIVVASDGFVGMDTITSARKPYGFSTDAIEFPEKNKLPKIFLEEQTGEDLKIYHRDKGKIIIGYLNKDYPIPRKPESFNNYKVLIGKTWGNMSDNYLGGAYSDIVIVGPKDVCTEKFLVSGSFDSFETAVKHSKYLMTTFCRALLFRNKHIQDNSKDKWKSVPVQNYLEDWWNKSIDEIDIELFKKYNIPNDIMEYVMKKVQKRTEKNIINI